VKTVKSHKQTTFFGQDGADSTTTSAWTSLAYGYKAMAVAHDAAVDVEQFMDDRRDERA